MNVVLFEPSVTFPVHLSPTDRRCRHIQDILRLKAGEELSIGVLNGCLGSGRIRHSNQQGVILDVLSLDQPPPKPLPITLVLALPRPPMLQRTLAAVASLGIKAVFLIQTNRVEKSYWNSHTLDLEEVQKTLMAGLEQAKDTVLPDVILKKRFRPFVEDELEKISEGTTRFLAHPHIESAACPANISDPVTLAIGPEGGFVPFEVDLFKQKGFRLIHFGPRVLRVETVVTGLVSRIMKLP